MTRWIITGTCIILAVAFVVTAFMQWKFERIVLDDVLYMTKQMMEAPDEMPWPRSEGSFR